MIDFEKEIEKVTRCVIDLKTLYCMNFTFNVYPRYINNETKTIISFFRERKVEIIIMTGLTEKAIRRKLLENIICLMRGSLDSYENFYTNQRSY